MSALIVIVIILFVAAAAYVGVSIWRKSFDPRKWVKGDTDKDGADKDSDDKDSTDKDSTDKDSDDALAKLNAKERCMVKCTREQCGTDRTNQAAGLFCTGFDHDRCDKTAVYCKTTDNGCAPRWPRKTDLTGIGSCFDSSHKTCKKRCG